MGIDAAVLQPIPEFLRVFNGTADLFVIIPSLEHKELSEKLISVGNLIIVIIRRGKLPNSSRPKTGDRAQISLSRCVLPIFHGIIWHLGLAWIVAISCLSAYVSRVVWCGVVYFNGTFRYDFKNWQYRAQWCRDTVKWERNWKKSF